MELNLDTYHAEPVNHTFLFLATIAWWLVRTILMKLFIHRTCHWILGTKPGEKLPKKEQVAFHKSEKYIWHAIGYLFMVIWVTKILVSHPWGFDFAEIAKSYPVADDDVSEIKYLMWIQVAWYIHGLIECVLFDRTRSDFAMMLFHHIIAVILIYGSYLTGGHRVGLTVTFEQDISDIVLYCAKVWQKATADIDGNPLSPFYRSTHTFAILCVAIAWFLTRHVTLALICWNVHLYLAMNCWWRIFLYVQLLALLVLQLIWGLGLFKMTWDQLTRGAFTDMWHDAKSPKAGDSKSSPKAASAVEDSKKRGSSPPPASPSVAKTVSGATAGRTPSPPKGRRSQKEE